MKLSNGIIVLEIEERTGSLVQLRDLKRNVDHIVDPAYARLFRVVAPDDDHWLSRHADSHDSTPTAMQVDGDTLTIEYDDLSTPDGTSVGVAVTVTVQLSEGADEAVFSIEVQNRSTFRIDEIWFPWIGGWRGYDGADDYAMMLGNGTCADPFHIRASIFGASTFLKGHRRRYVGLNTGGLGLPMADLSGGRNGLSYLHYPSAQQLGGIVVEDQNEWGGDSLPAWSWVHAVPVQSGESWRSDPIGIAPHDGDWHSTADRMRDWLETWWEPPPTPNRLRESIGLQNVAFQDFEGQHLRPYSDLPKLARHGLEHGIADFCVWDMTLLGLYTKAGHGPLLDDSPARLDELRRALAETRELGVNVSPLTNLRLINTTNVMWREWGEEWIIRNRHDQPSLETYPIRSEYASYFQWALDEGGRILCQSHPDFQQYALDMCERIRELGFMSLFLDQPFEGSLCFVEAHGHDTPACVNVGACEWTRQVLDTLRKHDPEAYTIGENPDIWNTQSLPLWWNWAWATKHAEVFRYTLPDSLQTWVIDAYEHQHQVGKAFAMGFLLAINVRGLEKTLLDVPDFAARIKRLAGLRRKTAHCTVHGRFRDRQGLEVDVPDDVAVYRYDCDQCIGIILADCAVKPHDGRTVHIRLNPDIPGHELPGSALLHREDGTTETIVAKRDRDAVSVSLRLRHWEAVVLELRHKGME